MKKSEIILAIFLGMLIVGLYFTTLRWLLYAWLRNDYYSHGLLVFPVSLFLIWLNRRRIRQAGMERGYLGIVVLIFAGILYLVGFIIHQPTILAFSLLCFVTALALQFLGKRKTKHLLFPILLIALTIPVPYFDRLGTLLQGLSASGASALAAFFVAQVSSFGNFITISGSTYEVAPACSGLNRVMPLLSLTAILVYFFRGNNLRRIILLALVLPFALLSNILRITITLLIGSAYGADAALGFFHDFSSIFLFVFALALVISAAWLLNLRRLRREVLV